MKLDSFFSLGTKLRSQYQICSSLTILVRRDKCDKFYKSNNNNNKTSNIACTHLMRFNADDRTHEKEQLTLYKMS